MKHRKILGLLAAAIATLMAFAATASATTLTSSTGETPTIHAESEVKTTLHNPIATIACNSTVTGTVEQHGSGVTVKGNISTLSFTACEGGTVHTDASGMVTTPGSLEIHPTATTGNGTVTSSGASISVTLLGINCIYTTKETHIGELTGGTNATLDIVGANIPRTGGSVFCGSSGNLTGSYKVTHPTGLAIHSALAAPTVTSSTGETPTIHAESEGKLALHNPIARIACNSTLTSAVEQHGASVPTKGSISTLSFTACEGGTVHTGEGGMVATPGSLEIHPTATTGNGTVTSSGASISVTLIGINCIYTTESTHIGELTGGEHATLDIVGANIPRTGGSVFCGKSGNLTGAYKITHPTDLTFHSPPPPTVTSSTGETPAIHAETEGKLALHNPLFGIKCNSTLTSAVEQHGAGVTTNGKIATLSFTACEGGTVHTDTSGMVATPGSLELHSTGTTGNATVTSTGASISVTLLGYNCIYTTSHTHIGELTGGEHATLDIVGANIPRTGGSAFCGSSGNLTGSYKVTHPTDLTFH